MPPHCPLLAVSAAQNMRFHIIVGRRHALWQLVDTSTTSNISFLFFGRLKRPCQIYERNSRWHQQFRSCLRKGNEQKLSNTSEVRLKYLWYERYCHETTVPCPKANNPHYQAPNKTLFLFMSDLLAESIQQSDFLIAEWNNLI